MNEVFIIGGGAAGLTAGITLLRKGIKTVIVEKNSTLGKKILVTGNGKCNYFNDDFKIDYYMSTYLDILSTIINDNNKDKVLNFFDSLGIIPRIKNGYYYPYSNQAVSVQNILLTEYKSLGGRFILDTEIISITKDDSSFILKDINKNTYRSSRVIMACGSKALYDNYFGYKILDTLGLKINKVLPGLVGLKGNDDFYKEWNGIRTDVRIGLMIDDVKIREEVGEIQLTNYGISGICTMNLSNYVVAALDDGKSTEVIINFLDYLNINGTVEAINFIKSRDESLKNRTISELLDSVLNYKLVNLLLKKCRISNNACVRDINPKLLEYLARKLTHFKMVVCGYNDFKDAQICLGGLSLKEININTFETKIPGLYVIGELLDVAGVCGGYNLGFAWLSGLLCAESIGEYNA